MSGGVVVVGAGLAGAEATWQLVRRGVAVVLYEMRPVKSTPAHRTGEFAELVCSNSLRAEALTNAVGLLKEEMRRLGSLIMACADAHRVPAGGALAVDRELFAAAVTERLTGHPLVTVRHEEITAVPAAEPVILATGPLTSDALADEIRRLTGREHLYFFDAVAPIVTLESIGQDRVFRSSRYGRGEPAYLNCPMSREEYERFWEALVAAERAPRHGFERETHFEGCLPVEVIAARGRETLLYGPLKPVGLVDPRTGERPYAVVQLRQDNRAGTLYNLVGFQTNLKWGEQHRVFSMIPGLEQAEFVRYGVMHRNTYINAPVLLSPTLMLKSRPGLFVAGQLSGVEGYVESAAAGLAAGLNAARLSKGRELLIFPPETAHGALLNYIGGTRGHPGVPGGTRFSGSAGQRVSGSAGPANFQPMNVNFGLFPPLPGKRIRRRPERNLALAQRALERLAAWLAEKGEDSVPFD